LRMGQETSKRAASNKTGRAVEAGGNIPLCGIVTQEAAAPSRFPLIVIVGQKRVKKVPQRKPAPGLTAAGRDKARHKKGAFCRGGWQRRTLSPGLARTAKARITESCGSRALHESVDLRSDSFGVSDGGQVAAAAQTHMTAAVDARL